MQLPTFEKLYDAFVDKGFDAVYCMSVNDSYVMNAWSKDQNLKNVKVIPDGNGEFTRQMGMLVEKRPECFGMRSWRYAVVVDNLKITQWFVEPGYQDNCLSDPYSVTNPESILDNLFD
jgi:peroxiredoxin